MSSRALLLARATAGVLALAVLPGAGWAQASAPPSADELRQMRQDLDALKAESAAAKAAEQERARRIEALSAQLSRVSGEPSPTPPGPSAPDIQTLPAQQAEATPPPAKWGGFEPGKGLGAQVVAAGNINWTFNDALRVYLGIQSMPSTRSTNRTFPYWLRNDNRPIADEFFRGSYTQGIWADGKIATGLEYRVMLANNLSALGVNAGQLDAEIDTFAGALTWMPTTGEFGPANGFGDFEEHHVRPAQHSKHSLNRRAVKDELSFDGSKLSSCSGTLSEVLSSSHAALLQLD